MYEDISTKEDFNQSARFDPVDLVSLLLKNLLKREQEVLKRRFALHGENKDTLEKIGKEYGITRERVRQIEVSGLKKIKSMAQEQREKSRIKLIENAMENILDSHGGIIREDILLVQILLMFNQSDNEIYRKNLLFLISQLLEENEKLLNLVGDNQYEAFWFLNSVDIEKIKESINNIVNFFANYGKPVVLEYLFNNLNKENIYSNCISTGEENEASNNDKFRKFIVSQLHISKKTGQNILDQWGLIEWNTIVPKRMNDKIYLVLKKESNPLHFTEIAQKINEMGFDKKIAYPATVHNELILDKKYILVGRGVYALRDWGYNDGTVSEVIVNIFKQENRPLEKKEIIDKVLKQRMVRKTTVALALNDRSKFKLEEGKYTLV